MDFDSVFIYPGGVSRRQLINSGCGIEDDSGGVSETTSFLKRIRNTSRKEYLAYCTGLEQRGYQTVFLRDVPSGFYRTFLTEYGMVHSYYTPARRETRIVLDRSGVPVNVFTEKDPVFIRPDTELMQFSLYYGPMIRGLSADCGMMYVFRLRTNELIIIDGGIREQATEDAMEEFVKRVRELTCAEEGEKIRIALWICTHAHDDHMEFLPILMRTHPGLFVLKRMLFNFPPRSFRGMSACVDQVKKDLRLLAPDALCHKAHTGELLQVGNAGIEILLTGEDLYEGRRDRYSFNGTSVILKIETEGFRTLIMGDAERANCRILTERFGESLRPCHFLQAAHHVINDLEDWYAFVQADWVLAPQGEENIRKRFSSQYEGIVRHTSPDRILLAGSATTVFRLCEEKIEKTDFPPVGHPFP